MKGAFIFLGLVLLCGSAAADYSAVDGFKTLIHLVGALLFGVIDSAFYIFIFFCAVLMLFALLGLGAFFLRYVWGWVVK